MTHETVIVLSMLVSMVCFCALAYRLGRSAGRREERGLKITPDGWPISREEIDRRFAE